MTSRHTGGVGFLIGKPMIWGEYMDGWDSFSQSEHWDALCEFAVLRGIPASGMVEDGGKIRCVMRTADPRLNPDAVRSCESSTAFRREVIPTLDNHVRREHAKYAKPL